MNIKKACIAAAPLYLLTQFVSGQNRPNIIFILTDDHRYDAVGYSGNKDVITPNIDSLAKKGTIFSNARVTNPISCASRACILTGQYSIRNGIYDFSTPLDSTQRSHTYPALLKSNGYYTGFIGKYGVSENNPVAGGDMFDWVRCVKGQGHYFASLMPKDRHSPIPEHPDPAEKHLTRVQGEQALDFLRTRDSSKPFCLSISFKAPHCQDELRSIGDEFPIDPCDSILHRGVYFVQSPLCNDRYYNQMREAFRTNSHGVMNIARFRWLYRFSTDSLYQETVRKYYSLIHGVDREIGIITDELRREGIDGNTVIIFMGDNGYYLGEYGLAGKWYHHEESLRVPLFIYDPRDKKGETDERNVLNVDIAPTILSFAKVDIPKDAIMDGIPLTKKSAGRKEFYFEHAYTPDPQKTFIPSMEGIVCGPYKLVHYITPDACWYSLYDMNSPAGETEDIITRETRRASVLRNKMNRLKNRLTPTMQ